MAANTNRNTNSMETILTFENRNVSQWSVVWSTAHVPGMDTAMGGGNTRRPTGRRRLRIGTYALGAFLTMHCRIAASAITGGFFIFIMFLILAVVLLANPLRHFEIYLGQWSISGPGRAFRIIPMFDGLGLAICINALVRAITCCTIAAVSAVYVLHAVSDARLPFTYCRDFDLNTYEPTLTDLKSMDKLKENDDFLTYESITVGLKDGAWRNVTLQSETKMKNIGRLRQVEICKEVYYGGYPPVFNTPPYNFFYVEVVQYRPNLSFTNYNFLLMFFIVVAWIIIWMVLLKEKVSHGRLIWNNMYSWFIVVPWLWTAFMVVATIINFKPLQSVLRTTFRLDNMDILSAIADALQVAMYIHSASTGTEIIHGKGLNHYASGHIDPQLDGENVWHSGLVLLLAVLNCANSAFCALADVMQVKIQEAHVLHESSLWVIPMYSKCAVNSSHSHLISASIFGGLAFSYMVVGYSFMKTALHTIFEYKVKLVFIEQIVVGIVIIICMISSLIFAANGGLPLLESVDAIMTGVAMPLVCLQELVVMLWIYRSHDFISDMNIATEDNYCSSRIGTQWQILPLIVLVTIGLKVSVITRSELPRHCLYLALLPLLATVLAVPLRACFNAYKFFRPLQQRK